MAEQLCELRKRGGTDISINDFITEEWTYISGSSACHYQYWDRAKLIAAGYTKMRMTKTGSKAPTMRYYIGSASTTMTSDTWYDIPASDFALWTGTTSGSSTSTKYKFEFS